MIKLYLKKGKWFDLISFLKWYFKKSYYNFEYNIMYNHKVLIKNKKLTFP